MNEKLVIEGRNRVKEALRSGRSIDRLLVQENLSQEPVIQRIINMAKEQGILYQFANKDKLDERTEGRKHQGVVAYVAAYDYVSVNQILEQAQAKKEKPFIVILDEIQDPHNLGAIIRTANLAGCHGIIIPKRRSSHLTEVVARTAAGALEYTAVAKVGNINQTIDQLKKSGVWIVGCDMDGQSMYKVDLKGPLALVIGNEGKGLSTLTRNKCDFIASIPMYGQIDSLNASVATGVMLYEAVRQRTGGTNVS